MLVAQLKRPRAGGALAQLLLGLVVLGALGAFAWMLLLPEYVTRQIKSRTGFDASVSSLSCNPFAGRLTLRGFVLSNPSSFASADFLQLREFHAEFDVGSLFAERVSVEDLRIDVRRIALVRRFDGESNASLLARNLGLGAPVSGAPGPAPRPAADSPEKKFRIRRLAIRVDQLVVADYSGANPDVKRYDLALDQHYENVTEAKQILVPAVLGRVAAENLGPVLGRVLPGDLGLAFGESARAAARSGGVLLKEAGAQASDLLRGLREKLEQSKKP